MTTIEYTSGMLRTQGRRFRHSWRDHILKIDHVYGAHKDKAWGKTLCGVYASMDVREKVSLTDADCQRCAKAWAKIQGTAA